MLNICVKLYQNRFHLKGVTGMTDYFLNTPNVTFTLILKFLVCKLVQDIVTLSICVKLYHNLPINKGS